MKLSGMMALTGSMALTSLAQASQITMWREPKPVIKQGKYFSLIVDRGELHKAAENQYHDYVFTEKGPGIKPLVLIGTPTEISEFLLSNETRGIENHIEELPEIYMGISRYIPRQRFSGLFPLQDLLTKTVDQVLKFVPAGTVLTDAAGVPSDLNALREAIMSMSEKEKAAGEMLYVKFSYLPEEGLKKIASRTVSFGKILRELQRHP